ncbi:DNA primase, catalytic core [secondary endosymbiont of Heteropsylla cubana]|uniref:DNA primase n=1 Tax=secondary endosymbiont of Heteropsylla cubana TaxID=134287 RepID=J3TGQ1_9ENTR|nr:DNA primase [secondary endosymbiont of Heteropsylla cubana]AFP85672.1 DNA primase, catalytic core [secondary endosymbiont of Heteropsylla cubana]
MVRKIPRVFINELLAKTDIVDLINARVKLKKQGKNFQACCPFHHEKTPSFTVKREKQFYYCFGCGAHGNAIDFLMHYEKLKFIDSIEELATQQGLEVPYEGNVESNQEKLYRRKNLYDLMDKFNQFYQQSLQTQTASDARHYLKQRGISEKIINYFSIGYAPPGWNNLYKHFICLGEDKDLLQHTGMLVVNHHGHTYDRFRNRIMFPIRDKRGRVIAFGGRIFDKTRQPKYLNSTESDIFHKGHELYGLYETQQKNQKLSRLLVVEGYIDVVSLTQFGINYAVALLGTSTTKEHIQLLYRVTDQVICCYDGDEAGQKAAWRALKYALPSLTDGRQLRFMFLPRGEDPDTLVRKIGKNAFQQYIEKAKSLSTFLFETLMRQIDLSSQEGRAKLSTLALPLIKQVPGNTLRLYLRQQLGYKLGILDDARLEKLLPKSTIQVNNFQQPKIKRTTMRTLIALLLQNPQLSTLVPSVEGLDRIDIPGIALFISLVNICQSQPKLTNGQLLECYRGYRTYSQLETLATWNHLIIDEMIETTFVDTLKNFYDSILEHHQETLIARDRTRGLTTNERLELWSLNQELAKKH